MPIPLRADYDAARLRSAARESKDAGQTRRLLTLAAIYDGATRTEAAAIEAGPTPAIHGVVRWRIVDLVQWLWDESQVAVSKQTLGRELRAMGYRKLSARPRHHAQAAGAIEAFKKSPRAPGCDRARCGRRAWLRRDLVRRRGSDRPEEQDHPTLDEARHAALSPAGPAHGVDLPLRRDLPADRRHSRLGPAVLQHRGDEPAPGRDLRPGDARAALRAADGSGRLAYVGSPRA